MRNVTNVDIRGDIDIAHLRIQHVIDALDAAQCANGELDEDADVLIEILEKVADFLEDISQAL